MLLKCLDCCIKEYTSIKNENSYIINDYIEYRQIASILIFFLTIISIVSVLYSLSITHNVELELISLKRKRENKQFNKNKKQIYNKYKK